MSVGQIASDFGVVRNDDQAWWTAYLARHRASSERSTTWLFFAGVLGLIVVAAANALVARAAKCRDTDLAQRDHTLQEVAAGNEFEARLQRALEMSTTERRVYGVVEAALNETMPDLSIEMLLADSSRAHFQQVATTGTATDRRCTVESPSECPAAQRGQVLTFASNRALDACPYLTEESEHCSAVCVPVSVSGMTVGVVHAAGAPDQPPAPDRRATLELVARRSSDRIGMMRAFARSEIQASTDLLTGLPNRRAFEEEVRQLSVLGTPYAVAFGDLDHFKVLNDVHGHGAGDQALRVFAQVLRNNLRPGDLFCRFGGEEFVTALPNCDATEAVEILDRVRDKLADELRTAGGPTFTVSFGLAPGDAGRQLDSLVSAADAALLQAKSLGRDRIVLADSGRPPPWPLRGPPDRPVCFGKASLLTS